MKNKDRPMSPNSVTSGATKREYFALKILTAFLASGKNINHFGSHHQMIDEAYSLADSMLEEKYE